MSRKERRAAEHAARKAARKAGFPITSEPVTVIHSPVDTPNRTASASESDPAPVTKISPARLAANRANAQLSKGAVTEIGRSISSQNRLTHGLARHNGVFKFLPAEAPLGFEALKASLAEEHEPTTETESILVNSMAESHWLAQRALNLQAFCFDPETGAITNEKLFSLYLRYQTTHTRAFHKSLNDLLKLRSERRKADLGFEAQKAKIAGQRLKNDLQYYTNQLRRLDLLERNPLYQADLSRLGRAAETNASEFKRLKAEFDATYQISSVQGAVAA